MNGTYGTGRTITYGFCPGCKRLHQITDCPDSNPPEEACICCEAISAEAAMQRAWQ